MTHPASCKSPSTCTLSYREHLVGFALSCTAIPNRAITHTPGQPDEPAIRTHTREQRWARDHAAFSRLTQQGVMPPHIDGSALREREGKTEYDVTQRPVTIDYKDGN